MLVRTCQDDERNFCIVEADTDPGTPAGGDTSSDAAALLIGRQRRAPIRLAAAAECVYVDLIRNPEAYTGFSGKNARRVWRSIYEENCFNTVNLPPDEEREGSAWGQSPSPLVQPTCLEERIFYRILSGMHASIAVHLSSRYTKDEAGNWVHFRSSGSALARSAAYMLLLFPVAVVHQVSNDTLLAQRVGNHPERIENLYFAYLFVLRSVVKLSQYLPAYDLFTGNATEDENVQVWASAMMCVAPVKRALIVLGRALPLFWEALPAAGQVDCDVLHVVPAHL